MKTKSKILFLISSLVLIVTFFTPIWKISLSAPQYPEGLGLLIWIDKVDGLNENDLKTINGLNHYIGMKEIHPDEIPELKYMPYIIVFFILFGVIGAFFGNEKWILIWLILIIITGFAGIYDFYQWEYEYGTNLNPNAPIRVPGANYIPPLIGTKQLLNIKATSTPYIGAIALFVGIGLAWYAYYTETKDE